MLVKLNFVMEVQVVLKGLKLMLKKLFDKNIDKSIKRCRHCCIGCKYVDICYIDGGYSNDI